MLITFRSSAWSNITMFGDSAITLLKMMGHSGTVPGALRGPDIPAALERLRLALDVAEPETTSEPGVREGSEASDTAPPVGLRLRAYPLIRLLLAAARQHSDVMWNEGAPAA